MPTKRITLKADNIEGAAEQIIHLLKDTDKGGDVIYLHGWYGWGASAILKDVVRRLRSSLGSGDTGTAGGLEKIIHVDFSQWQSKRALQKAIAKELELAEQVMALFDQCDEEDDFDGVEHSARGAIPHVKLAIMNELIARRFLVVLHNGSGRFIELREVGVPLLGELGKRVLWTSRGGFGTHVTSRHYDEDGDLMEESAGLSDVAIRFDLSSSSDDDVDAAVVEVKNIMYAEIEEVARYTGVPEPDMSLNIVTECILYMAAIGSDQDISEQRQEEPRRFPRLKRIHLYDLPKLQRICGRRMLAPRLETVKVRGCWGLKRLPPAVTQESSSPASSPITVVDLDCEKEWWNRLEWDGEKAGHCPSHYKPTFSAYYKKKLLRASVLR